MKTFVLSIVLLFSLSNLYSKTSFEVEVSGAGEAIIFIPGLACDGSVWKEAVQRYKSNYECHVLSLAGFSDLPAVDFSAGFIESNTRELIEYIERNNLDSPTIVGHSLGGFIALNAASKKSDIATHLLIVDSLPFLPAAMNPNATADSSKVQAASQRQMMSTNGQSEQQLRMMLNTMITDPGDIERALKMSLKSDGPTVAQAMYELNTIDLRKNVSNISTPTTVLGAWYGYADFGATKESTAAIFNSQYTRHPNFRLVMSERGKHFIMWDDPTLFNNELDRILAERDR